MYAVDVKRKQSFATRVKKDLKKHWRAYLIALPVVLYYLLFHYKPMYGLVIAFKDYSPGAGIWGSEWVGLRHFRDFVNIFYNKRV